MKKIFLAVFISLFFIFPKNLTEAQEIPDLECVGRELAKYVNGVIDNAGSLENVKLLSPAFNLGSPYEVEMFGYMVEYGANFAALDGFSGNLYSHPQGLDLRAYQQYTELGWKGRFDSYGKPVVITEFGDFRLSPDDSTKDARQWLIDEMIMEFNDVHSDPGIISTLYFSVLDYNKYGGNAGFSWNNMSDGEISTVIASNPGVAGANSASIVDGTGSFPVKVVSTGTGLTWVLEITMGPGDIANTIAAVRSAHAQGLVPVVRFCHQFGCGFSADPAELAAFIRQLDAAVDQEVWVIAGPNEPVAELWATPECQGRDWKVEWWDCSEIARDTETGEESAEFHSLRPYPASNTCSATNPDLVSICGNDMLVIEDIEVTPRDGSCSGSTCHFEIQGQTEITIDTTNLELPILGNTGLVPNGVSGANILSFEERVNEYVSWYLNGVIQRAEERYFISPRDIYELVNFSGPLRKLLPQQTQTTLRQTQKNEVGGTRHDQIVACRDGEDPTACYVRQQEEYERISEVSITRPNNPTTSYIPYSSTEDADGYIYGPPSSWEPATETIGEVEISNLSIDYDQDVDSLERLYFAHIFENKKLGETLQSTYLPGKPPKKTFTLTAPLLPTPNSPLWPDWVTRYLLDHGLPILPDDLNDLDIDIEIPLPDALQPDGPNFDEIPADVVLPEQEGGCTIVGAVNNPGDDLYGELDETTRENKRELSGEKYEDFIENEGSVTGVINYTATFDHTFDEAFSDSDNSANQTCKSNCLLGPLDQMTACSAQCDVDFPPSTEQKYTARVVIKIPVALEMPGANDIWADFVGGSGSIFRKMFPKIGAGSARDKIIDLPGESNASYEADNILVSGGQLTNEITLAGNIDKPVPGSSASVYFPHLGGISEYFLKDIQKMLRPKGVSGGQIETTKNECSINCNTSATLSPEAQKYEFLRDIVIDLAGRWTETQQNPGKNYAKECFNDVINQSVAKGVNPALTLTIWLNESGASNYTSSVTSCVTQDFGINKPEIASDFKAQLNGFLALPGSLGYEDCAYDEDQNWEAPIHGFLNRFKQGGCDPTDEVGNNYYELIQREWEFLNLSCPFPDYPTDMSCP